MSWPRALVAELASRRCIVFAGAGVSTGARSRDGTKRPLLWEPFLNELRGAMHSTLGQTVIEELLNSRKYLDAAEVICANIAPADFAQIVRDNLIKPRFSPSKMHESLLKIDPKVVVTTNYDDIYDSYCRSGQAQDGYNICRYYDDHLVNDLRSPVRIVIKAHGCVSDPSKIVLTRSQYFQERQRYISFYNVLDALFLTNTILFLGYSLSDPDIQLTLENSNISARSAHTHYALVEDNIHGEIERAMSLSYNIQFIKYPAGDHSCAEIMLDQLSQEVSQTRAVYLD